MRGVNVFILMVGCVLILSFVCQMEVGIDHKDLTADSRSIDEANPEINYATVELPHQIATDSGPFYIDGDEELVAMAILHDWDGDGTEEWPYIIAGYEIYVNDDADVSCIEIHNIEFTYFIIRDCTLQGAIAPNYDPDINPYGNLRAGIYLYNVYGCIITENTIIGNLEGIYLNQTTSCYVFDNECFGNIYDGICTVMYSTKNHIYDNYCHDNYWDGILIWGGSYENNITRNHCTNNHRAGITLVYTTLYGAAFQNNVSENTCVGNANWAIDIRGYCYENIIMNNYCEGSNTGLVISMAHDNTIFDNTVFDCNYGIHMWDTHQNTIRNNTCFDGGEFGFQVFYSTHNTFVLNNITNFETGIYLEESSDNLIYWNSILFNDIQVTVINSPSGNDWYHPEFLEGNIWSDYIGVDFDGDGIGDTDIPWPGEGYDLYPLVIDGDGDGISDYGELVIGTDPEDPDTDFDGFSDGDEWRLHFTDPLEPGPFYIDGDEELAEMAAYHGWEGSGEYEDPYIIEGYDIDVNDADVSCIEIRNIDSTYFIIRECTVTGASGPYANEYPNPPFIYARAGIYLYNVYYAEVTNNLVFGNCYGIRIDESYAVTISENMCHSNNWEGIAVILNSEQCIVRDNFCFANIDGIGYLGNGIGVGVGAHDNLIVQNIVFDNEGSGIMFYTAYDSIARENQCYGNLEWGIAMRGGSSGNQILKNQCWNNYQGIYLDNSDSNTIAENQLIDNTEDGILLSEGCDWNTVVYNYCTGNYDGIRIGSDVGWNVIVNNLCYENTYYGIILEIGAMGCNVTRNLCVNNEWGILVNNNNSILFQNNCTGNYNGIEIHGFGNMVVSNFVKDNNVGVYLKGCSYNIIFYNFIIDNSIQALEVDSTDWNFWYDPYLLEGNVWSDYIGVDFDRDGIGDTDIAWPGPGFDLYPLVTGDFDNDGLSYYTELAIGTDPYNDDTDGDFFKDGDEWRFYFTDPLTFDTPQEVSEVIDSNLEELVDEGVLEQNDVTPLIRKLDAARDLMDRGKLFQATQKLRDFISQINAMINRGQLSEEEGYALIAIAQALIDVILTM